MSRYCIKEIYHEAEGIDVDRNNCLVSRSTIKVWEFHYDDGSTETLTMREPVE